MAREKKWIVAICAAAILTGVVVVIVKVHVARLFETSPRRSRKSIIWGSSNSMLYYFQEYYKQLNGRVPENPSSDFVDYLVGLEGNDIFSREAPAAGYESRRNRDISFFLSLPANLESNGPIMVGYTGGVSSTHQDNWRCMFFLREGEIAVVMLPDFHLKAIIGKERFENEKPDFYIWRDMLRYLRIKSRKNTKTITEADKASQPR